MLAQLGRNDVSYLVKIGGVNAKEYGHVAGESWASCMSKLVCC